MPRATNTEALADMRLLQPTDTGRLLGLPTRHAAPGTVAAQLFNTPQPWRSRLLADVAARARGTVTADSAEYLVASDHTVIAVLTAAARIIRPDYPLSAVQRRHQRAAAAALADLPRHLLRELADRRSERDGRSGQAAGGVDRPPATGAIQVAARTEPTVTHWVAVTADLAGTRAAIAATGLDPDQLLIITAVGYGRYGRERHRLPLPALCALHQIAERHQVSLPVCGDWLDMQATTDPDPSRIAAAFTAGYLGPFADELAYTRHRMAALGWTAALQQAGIPERYIDQRAITRDWFTRDVYGIYCATRHRTEVFRRATPG
ncbi:hypothetical protein ACQP2F_14500 [Actinoplanes sp. CA-030573]|uniref:hypothetical protein n=1 Tax=Actinoplanes sp. CA-030573 TaxID=3239898 RepID=UPI003D8B04D9